MLYLLLKWLHILLAIIAVGANITYGVWIARAERSPEVLPFVLRGIKFLDNRIANPAYGLLLVTGLAMVLVSGIPLTTPWISLSLVLYVAAIAMGIFIFTPLSRRRLELVEGGGHGSEEYRALARKERVLAAVLAVLVVTIVFLMVVKPR